MMKVSPIARRNRRRFAWIECWVGGMAALTGTAGYMLHVTALEFVGVLGAVAGLAFLVARNLLVPD